MTTDRLVAVHEAVQELCRDLYGVTAVTHESTGQVCNLPSTTRQASDRVLEQHLGGRSVRL